MMTEFKISQWTDLFATSPLVTYFLQRSNFYEVDQVISLPKSLNDFQMHLEENNEPLP